MEHEQKDRIVDLAARLADIADEIDQVVIIYRRKSSSDDGDTALQGSMDNELEVRDAMWLVDGYTFWMKAAALGIYKRK